MKQNILTVPIQKVDREGALSAQDLVAVEEPLEILLNDRNVAITMRTPGNDEELAAGFLFGEGILRDRAAVRDVSAIAPNRVNVATREENVDLDRLERHFYISSSCGVCGKASIQAVEAMECAPVPRHQPVISRNLVPRLPEILRSRQSAFDRTGGLHAAALLDTQGTMLDVREDVGRHNAVDKLIGAAFLAGATPLHDRIVMVSGRASFELVQKALMAGIPIMAAVGAPSSLAVELALRFGMTLAGFVRHRRFNLYSGEWRVAD
ncbi:MAG TPA: formate dehydrogenase accessory sulfurtransferase FdhD [Bryobacteraceae bacterium]|nr:formate dehydrogenase accessory sulfurtransferase FdhD [Bryobacteraceae bacterium]